MARGLMGLLPNGGRWETPEAVSARLRADELLMARLVEYNRRRDELQAFENSTMPVGTTVQNRWAIHHPAAEVAAAHAKLGVWCERNGLKPEATRTSHKRSSSIPTATRPGNTSGTSSTTAAG